MKEYRCIGPPGCGKTTWLAKQVSRAVERHGSESVAVMSLTRAAAQEMVGRDLPIERERVGTMHSFCFHALERPRIAVEDKEVIESWNERCEQNGRQHWMFADSNDKERIYDYAEGGDEIFAKIDTLRARMVPTEDWEPDDQRFFEAWNDHKAHFYAYDFTDLIEVALDSIDACPGEPRFLFLDEGQDFSALEMALARKWGAKVEQLITAGDPDQAIYEWRGASAANFQLPRIPEDQYRYLEQSYRVPKEVHAFALEWIRQLGDERIDVTYKPRDAQGSLEEWDEDYSNSHDLVSDVEAHAADGKTVMILASAGYMLEPTLAELRDRGIAFHNPYAEKRGDWNPLRVRRDSTSVGQRVAAFLKGDWLDNSDALKKWLAMLKLTYFRSGAHVTREYISKLPQRIDTDDLLNVINRETFTRGAQSDLDWLRRGLLAQYKTKAFDYAVNIANRDISALFEEPKIVIGTIHSVKGGEADVVYLFPDLSPKGWRRYDNPDSRATAIRLFYVAFTRARETLVLGAPKRQRNEAGQIVTMGVDW